MNELPTTPHASVVAAHPGRRGQLWARSIIFCAVLLVGCTAVTPYSMRSDAIPITVVSAGAFPEASKLRAVHVRRFTGNVGPVFEAAMSDALSRIRIEGNVLAKVVGPRETAQAVVVGSAQVSHSDSVAQEARTECVKQGEGKNWYGKRNCAQERKVNVSCTLRQHLFTVSVQLQSPTGALLWSKQASDNPMRRACSDDRSMSLAIDQSEQALILGALAKSVLEEIVPSTKVEHVPLMTDATGLTEDVRRQFDSAIEFAKAGRFADRACDMFASLYRDASGAGSTPSRGMAPAAALPASSASERGKSAAILVPPAIVYNYALCLEASGDLTNAHQLYRQADATLTTPSRLFNDALKRVHRNQAAVSVLPVLNSGSDSDASSVAGIASPPAKREAQPVNNRVRELAVRPADIADAKVERRFALVIGNGNYRASPLKKSANDAMDVAQTLRRLNFNVEMATDASLGRMRAAIGQFLRKIPEGSVALIYYSGHGAQRDGVGYLLPTDYTFSQGSDLRKRAVDLKGEITDKLTQKRLKALLVFLDACRTGERENAPGIDFIEIPDSFFSLASRAGKPAYEGDDPRNGIFTKAFLKHVTATNIGIDEVQRRIQKDVVGASRGEQEPDYLNNLTKPMVTAPK